MIQKKEIHFVSFTIPYPANYGGVIDVFYKIKSLFELGLKIHLHCFKYDRIESSELNKYCESVRYYNRPKNLQYFFSRKPFIVVTRSNNKLLKMLQSDQLPIIFEGLHSTFFLEKLAVNNRNIIVRTHNIEHHYYKNLALQEKNTFVKFFFYCEALKLKHYQKVLKSNIKIAGITEKDCNYFKSLNSNTFLVDAFHPSENINISKGIGNYILFHGNLSVNENIKAIEYIIKNILPKINSKFKIAGKNPSKRVYKLKNDYKNIEIIANPSNEEMQSLVRNAQINLLITFQDTGIKLKLINALYNGRHCIVNREMIEGTGFKSLCHSGNTPNEIIKKINLLIKKPFNEREVSERKQILLKNVNNTFNAQKLINLLDKN